MASATSPVFYDKDGTAVSLKKRKARFTFSEIHVLLDEIRKNRHIVVGQFNAGVPCKLKKRTWAEITARVNEIGEGDREVIEIIKKWSDMKCDTKRKVAALRTGQTTIPGRRFQPEFTPTEEIIYQILSMDSSQGPGLSKRGARGGSRVMGSGTRKSVTMGLNAAQIGGDDTMDFALAPVENLSLGGGENGLPASLGLNSPARMSTPQGGSPSTAPSTSEITPPPFPDMTENSESGFTFDVSGDTSDLFDMSFEESNADDGNQQPDPDSSNQAKTTALSPSLSTSTSTGNDATSALATTTLPNGSTSRSIGAMLLSSLPSSSSAPLVTPTNTSSNVAPPSSTSRPRTSTPTTSAQSATEREDDIPSMTGADVAHAAALSVQEQRVSNALLETVSRSLELLAESVQQLAETQQEFIRESLQLQRESVQVLQDFATSAVTLLRSKLNSGHSTE